MHEKGIKASAPGRLCLLGEHQDYFGLPILAAAINLRISISGQNISPRKILLDLPDIDEKDEFPLDTELQYSQKRDYLKSAVNILQREGHSFASGWNCHIKGNIPINSGTASSSALVVTWIKFLLESLQDQRAQSPEDIAELAFASEVAEFQEPGGKMDHYASALGGIISVHFDPQLKVIPHKNRLQEFVLADSLIRKDTTGTLGFIKSNVFTGAKQIQQKLPQFNLKSPIGESELDIIETLPPIEQRLLMGTLMTRDITAEGEKLFAAEEFDHEEFGDLLTQQQDVVRDYLQISVPKIDRMIAVALEAGALGAKINGSGEGGCIFAYCPGKGKQVAEALRRLDTDPYVIHIDNGVRKEEE